ncbi:MAG: YicC family protein [Lachnospiraceae bacterium]|nr:YicC family protein [Lachnospiraceae bacterium]MBP3296576.1 YicC family protein [Lachnospiraceae bacterium]
MIKSMTGFGRCEMEEHARRITVEMKAVNHRYLDLSIKMPKKFNPFEAQIRNVLKEYIERGKVDLYITCEDLGEENLQIRYNRSVAAEYLQYLRQMSEEFGLEDDVRVSTLSRFPEVFSMEDIQQDEEEIWQDLEKVVRGAAKVFVESREREGEALKADLLDKLENMQKSVAQIEERSPQVIEEYREKLRAKVRELVGDVQLDESRLMMEVTVFADKICVDEEMVRLKSHITAMSQELKKGGSVGRKLDFIAQEMNREANTTLSKANDLLTSDAAIELKTGIEKIREQIQNLE